MMSIELRERVFFRSLWAVVIVAFLVVTVFWVSDVSSLMAGRTSERSVPSPTADNFAIPPGSIVFEAQSPAKGESPADALSSHDRCLQTVSRDEGALVVASSGLGRQLPSPRG